ncbi:MAG: PLP-dependent transferase [Verrucomicrobiales bacterium]
MRDLLKDPLWRSEDLGRPLPESPHACSVCLPTWESVVGYEENDPAVVGRMQAGYPRFFCHPLVQQVFELAAQDAQNGERALVFSSQQAAENASQFVLRGAHEGTSVFWSEFQDTPLWAVMFPRNLEKRSRLAWRFCGQGISSRVAAAVLDGWSREQFAAAERRGTEAQEQIKQRLAALSAQPPGNVFLFSSGMAGVFALHRALTSIFPGRKTVQMGFPYVDVLKVQEEFGAGVHFIAGVGKRDVAKFSEIVAREPLAGVFTEVPSNPLIESIDLEAVSQPAQRHRVPVVCDDTVATVVNADVFRFADVVTTSLTKAFSGVGDVMAGCVIVNEASAWISELRALLAREMAAAPLFAEDAVALETNSRDFAERVVKMNANAEAIAELLAAHHVVERVHYPTLDDTTAYEKIRRPGGGGGMLLSFTLRDKAKTPQVFDALRVCKGPSLGANFTLACPYTLLAHYTELDWAESCGVSRHLIRLSTGLEATDDLRSRLLEALALATH